MVILDQNRKSEKIKQIYKERVKTNVIWTSFTYILLTFLKETSAVQQY